jgi:hypothetical protein
VFPAPKNSHAEPLKKRLQPKLAALQIAEVL